ncbi:LTA synthase family protein [Aurantibacter sp.]|uniref:LTA synthase family protein n=1 Tax=Aurantibacter sp. TaxID=2807103 RepID=UPI0035C79A6A
MIFFGRLEEYIIFFYRLLLVFFFYQLARVLFYIYNLELIDINSISDFLNICYRGFAFDTTAILYINSLFILFSILPLVFNTSKRYQKVLFYLYFITNLIAYALNFVDFIYYKFTQTRTTTAALEAVQNESNGLGLFFVFLRDYWHVFVLFFIVAFIWIKVYKLIKFKNHLTTNSGLGYFLSSVVIFLVIATLCIGGIRGDFKHSTRPITLVDASRHVKILSQADMVLNTPFALIRTINKNYFKKQNKISEDIVKTVLNPIKQYNNVTKDKPNVVILIVESLSREYIGAFNTNTNIPNYKSYTPFLDSLSQESLIFPNTFANGRKSIHGMSSVLAGIPSFKVAYTSSPYSNQDTQSVVSILNEMHYDTSFFHGAPNGSMGFLGFSNILGFDHYYGKTEYNNDDDFDGLWGIWDKPYLKHVNSVLAKKVEPFMATVFTLSSHSPYIIPKKDKGKYPLGTLPMHKCVGYTDNALKEFFKEAKTKEWYNNSVFVITGDHTNLIDYPYYAKALNRFSVPIILFSPKGDYKGVNNSLAQQIDVYPTIVDIVGYNKPIRSWGRSVLNDTLVKPFAITNSSSTFHLQQDDYIYVFDSEKDIGFYNIEDKGLEKPLKKVSDSIKNTLRIKAKSFIQDYMNRIIDKKLTAE